MIGWQVLWGVNLYVKMIVGVKVFFWLNLTLLMIVIFAKAYVICLLNIEEYGSGNIAWILYWSPFDEGLSFLRIMIFFECTLYFRSGHSGLSCGINSTNFLIL